MTISGDICAFFFEPVHDPDAPHPGPPPPPPSPSAPKKRGRKKSVSLGGANRHRCKVCHNVYTQAVSTGYTNLLTHLRIKHPDWEEMFKSQQLESAAPVASSSEENGTKFSTRARSPSTTTSTAPKQKQTAGRKRGPVYEHFEDSPLTPGKKQKTMRCMYCHEDTAQLSARLKLHLSTKCPEVPEDVKAKYAGAVGLMSNKVEGAVVNKSEAVAKAESVAAAPETSTTFMSPATKPATTAFKSPTTKLQQKASPLVVSKGNLRVFEEKLTAAMIVTSAPWSLLDNVDFCEAMETLHPASQNFPLTATRARSEVLDRILQKYDRDCKDILATSNAITLTISNTDVGADGAKKTTYIAVDEWRRAFVLAAGRNPSVSPYVTEVLSVLSTLPSSSSSANIFLCAPTSGTYTRARQGLQRDASDSYKPITLMGVCMSQQTALLLHALLQCSMSLEDALDNTVLIAGALHDIPSLRDRVLRGIYADISHAAEAVNAFAPVSGSSWHSVAMAVKQATRLEAFLRVAISQESKDSSSSLPKLRPLVDMSSSDMAWNTLRHTAQLLVPLNYFSALSELQSTTSGQLLSLWIWLFGAATRSPLLDGKSNALATSFMQRLECYVEEHFVACMVLDPRVHGAGLSVSGLRRARGITVRVANSLIPNFNENNFIRSYNDYVKQQGDFGEPGVWNPANTSSPMEFWGDYEGDPMHNQLAVVAKTVCSFVPHTCSMEELWAAHAQRTQAANTEVSSEHEKCTKIRRGAALNARATAKEVVSRFQPLLAIDDEPSVEEFLQSNAAIQGNDEQDSSSRHLLVRSVLESVQDGLEDDEAGSNVRSMTPDASWFDISSAGLDKIRSSVEKYLSAVVQE
ncbi:hypothetical protein JG687_00010164 [Phytophthora cactorum]|uniref:BED-type domain-containing protein n=3 Tax=Phytophthora cactorum TaxID=29920 RepID=A0A8T1UBW9_9STRA|nr:hypothetical protein JG687_00010164 [Phytophthora cactorum]